MTRSRRLFVAVPVPVPVCEAVARLVASLPEEVARGVRWVGFDGLHLTVRFLGPTPESRLPDAVAAVNAAAGATSPFDIRLAGAGSFPSGRRPRVLWIGVAAGAPELAALARRVDADLVRRGWASDERPYRAHLTIARSDGVRSGPLAAEALVHAAEALSETFTADELVLYESHPARGPARYEPVHVAPLRYDG